MDNIPSSPLVSILTPVYNGQAWIGRLLDSVLAQSWPRVEMIVSDDGSTDATLEAAEPFRERFEEKGYELRIISGPHGGASSAMNRGLPLVSGKYLMWPDSDDELVQDAVRKKAEFLESHPDYGIVRGLPLYEQNGQSSFMLRKGENLDREDIFFPVIENTTFICCGCYMIRMEVFDRVCPGRRIIDSFTGQNFQMVLPMLYRQKCATIREPHYIVHLHPDSHSQSFRTREAMTGNAQETSSLLGKLFHLIGVTDPQDLEELRRWKEHLKLRPIFLNAHFYQIIPRLSCALIRRQIGVGTFMDGLGLMTKSSLSSLGRKVRRLLC